MTKKRPPVRIDVPNLIMHLREYDTEELQEFYAIFIESVEQLRDRSRDMRLERDIRRKARHKLKRARRQRNRIRMTLLCRGADLELKPEEWEQDEKESEG